MTGTSQTRAIQNYRKRLSKRGMGRYEVLGLDTDRELIRSLARCLAEGSPEVQAIRASVHRQIYAETVNKGRILAALQRSPLAELNLARPRIKGRQVEL